jgi:hypothetical protein
MDLVSIEAPAARAAGEALEFLDASLGIVASSKGLEVVADQLVETLSQRTGRPPGSSNYLFVDRKGDVHGHRIRAQGCCVTRAPLETRVHGRLEVPAWDRPGLFELGKIRRASSAKEAVSGARPVELGVGSF